MFNTLEIKALLMAMLVAGPLYLFGTFNHDLWRPAEAREAGIACRMLDNGDWAATYLNEDLFLEKPPLYTWALAMPLKIFGRHDWVVRLPVFGFTIGTLILTFYLARARLGIMGAQGTVVALATMWLFMEVNHGAMIDNGLMFFITLAMLAFYRIFHGTAHPRGWAMAFYTALALAFLTKGGIGPALILAALGGFVLAGRHWRLWHRARPLTGLIIILALAGGWLWALWLKGGSEYFHVFFVRNNLDRMMGRYGPTAPWHYYIPYFFASALPWTLLLPAGIWSIRPQWRDQTGAVQGYWQLLAWWVGAFFLLLSAAGGKDNQYLLPLLPPLAVVCGAWIEHTTKTPIIPRWTIWLMWIFTGAIAMAAAAMPWVAVAGDVPPDRTWLLAMAAWSLLSATAGILALRACQRRNWRAVWRGLALTAMLAGVTLGLFIEPTLNRMKSIRPLSSALRAELPDKTELWGYDLDENTVGALIFYGHRHHRLAGLGDHLRLLREPMPPWILLMSRDDPAPDVARLVNTGSWQVQAKITAGGRLFWLMAPSASSGMVKGNY